MLNLSLFKLSYTKFGTKQAKNFFIKNIQGSPLGDKKKPFLGQRIPQIPNYELPPIWACTPMGPLCPPKKSAASSFAVKTFVCANFEFRAKNFLNIYAQADRAIKDESIGILKSYIWIKNGISMSNLAEVIFS